MCVCVGRVSSTWSEAPIAAGGRPALRDGRRKLHESLYVALVRGDVREKKPTGPLLVQWFSGS